MHKDTGTIGDVCVCGCLGRGREVVLLWTSGNGLVFHHLGLGLRFPGHLAVRKHLLTRQS